MHRSPPTPRGRPQNLRAFSGSGLLLLYLAAATPLAPALTALLAATDSSHHVAIQQTSRGLQVVLRHDCSNSPTHRHGMVARVVTFFAQRTTSTQPDHVIQFTATDSVREAPALVVEPGMCALSLHTPPVCAAAIRFVLSNLFSAVFPRPPPVAGGLLLALRSTVLIV